MESTKADKGEIEAGEGVGIGGKDGLFALLLLLLLLPKLRKSLPFLLLLLLLLMMMLLMLLLLPLLLLLPVLGRVELGFSRFVDSGGF